LVGSFVGDDNLMRLSEAWEKYQLDKKIEGYSPLTLKAYCFQYTLLLKHFVDINIKDFTTDELKSYLIHSGDHLKKGELGAPSPMHQIPF
jgi:hypothetical protein